MTRIPGAQSPELRLHLSYCASVGPGGRDDAGRPRAPLAGPLPASPPALAAPAATRPLPDASLSSPTVSSSGDARSGAALICQCEEALLLPQRVIPPCHDASSFRLPLLSLRAMASFYGDDIKFQAKTE